MRISNAQERQQSPRGHLLHGQRRKKAGPTAPGPNCTEIKEGEGGRKRREGGEGYFIALKTQEHLATPRPLTGDQYSSGEGSCRIFLQKRGKGEGVIYTRQPAFAVFKRVDPARRKEREKSCNPSQVKAVRKEGRGTERRSADLQPRQKKKTGHQVYCNRKGKRGKKKKKRQRFGWPAPSLRREQGHGGDNRKKKRLLHLRKRRGDLRRKKKKVGSCRRKRDPPPSGRGKKKGKP